MFARIFALSALAMASALPASTVDGGSCNTGTLECCKSVQSPTSAPIQTLLGLLNIPIGSVTGQVGLTCNPITVIGLGTTQCANQPACCTGNNYNGLVALGCTPINVGL
ncbi:hydrophobin-251 [Armillaria borealis]|uniref:Hydrophobin n=1 Tax=Armillaria borealis TaxID=47425 RepID=A0AA39JLX3_9AGAR|nr:hydrophobin-251 [Armillaria borealis]